MNGVSVSPLLNFDIKYCLFKIKLMYLIEDKLFTYVTKRSVPSGNIS